MKSLYEVWQATGGSQAPNGEWQCWGACWDANGQVKLPLGPAKGYAKALAQVSGLPTEVRGKNHKVKAMFGQEIA
jgi:hypothetical protein